MKLHYDKAERTIGILIEPHEINKLIYDHLKENNYEFDEKEIELKYDFVKEGSPEYTTGKVKCTIKITKALNVKPIQPSRP